MLNQNEMQFIAYFATNWDGGISENRVNQLSPDMTPALNILVDKGYAQKTSGVWSISPKGWRIANAVEYNGGECYRLRECPNIIRAARRTRMAMIGIRAL